MVKAFQKAKFYQNLTSGSGSKQRFCKKTTGDGQIDPPPQQK